MPLARIDNKILHFVHIPKTGGTTIETYLAQKGSLALFHPGGLRWSACSPQHMHARLHAKLVPSDFFDHSFAVVREPVRRTVSAYRHQIAKGNRPPGFEEWLDRMFARFPDRPYLKDNHIRPQQHYLCEGVKVFRFEDGLDAVLDWIDAVTDGQRADRNLWHKRAEAPEVVVSDSARQKIETFYAEDCALWKALAPSD